MTNDSLFDRCIVLMASERLNERQIGWSGRWSLMGDFVVCTYCLNAQAIDQANAPFAHEAGCVATLQGLHPWHELQRLLNQLPRSPIEPLH